MPGSRADVPVLIAEDQLQMRTIIRTILGSLGFKKIYQAGNGFEGVQVLQEKYLHRAERVQLIISDWNMPDMNGLEFLTAVRAEPRFKDLPFMMLTSEGDREHVLSALQSGVTDYIVKPFSPTDFERKIKDILPTLWV